MISNFFKAISRSSNYSEGMLNRSEATLKEIQKLNVKLEENIATYETNSTRCTNAILFLLVGNAAASSMLRAITPLQQAGSSGNSAINSPGSK